jgi:hypothetical protein
MKRFSLEQQVQLFEFFLVAAICVKDEQKSLFIEVMGKGGPKYWAILRQWPKEIRNRMPVWLNAMIDGKGGDEPEAHAGDTDKDKQARDDKNQDSKKRGEDKDHISDKELAELKTVVDEMDAKAAKLKQEDKDLQKLQRENSKAIKKALKDKDYKKLLDFKNKEKVLLENIYKKQGELRDNNELRKSYEKTIKRNEELRDLDGPAIEIAKVEGAGHTVEDRFPDADKPLPATPIKENADQIEGAKGDWKTLFRYFPETTKEDWLPVGRNLKTYLDRPDVRQGYRGIIQGSREASDASATGTAQLSDAVASNNLPQLMNGALNVIESAEGTIRFAEGVNKLNPAAPVYSTQRIRTAQEEIKELKRKHTILTNTIDLADKGAAFLKTKKFPNLNTENLSAANSVLKHAGTAVSAADHVIGVKDAIKHARDQPEKLQGIMAGAAETAASATFFRSFPAGLKEAGRGALGLGGKLPVNGSQWALFSSMETQKAKIGRGATRTLNKAKDVMNGVPGAKEQMLKEAQTVNQLGRNFIQDSFKGAAKGIGDKTLGELPVIGGIYKTVTAWFSDPDSKTRAEERRAMERKAMEREWDEKFIKSLHSGVPGTRDHLGR